MQNFIVDFAILEDTNEMTIIEFNDFADFEGAGSNAELFDWREDSEILVGNQPFETRLVMHPLTREQLETTLTKPFRIHLGMLPYFVAHVMVGWDSVDSWKHGVDWY